MCAPSTSAPERDRAAAQFGASAADAAGPRRHPPKPPAAPAAFPSARDRLRAGLLQRRARQAAAAADEPAAAEPPRKRACKDGFQHHAQDVQDSAPTSNPVGAEQISAEGLPQIACEETGDAVGLVAPDAASLAVTPDAAGNAHLMWQGEDLNSACENVWCICDPLEPEHSPLLLEDSPHSIAPTVECERSNACICEPEHSPLLLEDSPLLL